ncbi:putative Receptor protein kinase [Quillaja saponaria]|uniref:non-specific serine/threonine protein kinase n=1 Tax=Quillaja saponaria TaxID=32244 RepID=A0AAD7LLT4_QUISA|nr:putative Receptor protein kinase [Quillaja saponaria]
MKPKIGFLVFLVLVASVCSIVESECSEGCELALASYYVNHGNNLESIAQYMQSDPDVIVSYNKDKIPNKDSVDAFIRINIPFRCDCIDGQYLGHKFNYTVVSGNTYGIVAQTKYAHLTTVEWLQKFNNFKPNNIPHSIANKTGLDSTLLQNYNPGVNFSRDSGLVFIPGKDQNGSYVPLKGLKPSTGGVAGGVIAGISVGGVAGILLLSVCVYVVFYRKKQAKVAKLLSEESNELSASASASAEFETSESAVTAESGAAGLTGFTMDKSVVFSYGELARATDNFSMASKIGQGGFGAVYYAELRGEKAAVKKMDMQASREFLAELKVLTHVHHLNLVRLIGYCVEGSLFLVYEYIENGNLSQHLRGSGRDPLPWSTRVQIALDSARGLEYIHEHTVPVYIHRDIKSANILIDKNFRGKVADFGLTKLTEVGSASLPTRLVGTFGYMPPEYAQYGDVSPKIDVYAFGVVLYELISAKQAVVKTNEFVTESKGLVTLFEGVLNQPDATDGLRKLVDHRLEDNYPIDSVRKMAQLAKACTQDNPQLRPSMRSIVVALITLSSPTEDWDIGSFYENQTLINLMSGG